MKHPAPAYTLSADGTDITGKLQGRLVSLTLTDNRGFEADQLDITLDDSDGQLAIPPLGASIALKLGWQGDGLVDKGSYTVDEVSHEGTPDQITLRARSADLRSGLTTAQTRSFHGKTLGEIVATIAAENDLKPKVSASLSSQLIEHLDQTSESSANLLTRLANQFDAVATVKQGALLFIVAGGGVTASGKPLPAVNIERKVGDRHHFSLAERGNYTHVRATWHDYGTGTTGEVTWSQEEEDIENGKRPPAPPPVPVGEWKNLSTTYKTRDRALTAARKEWTALSAKEPTRSRYVGVHAKYDDRHLKASGTVSYGKADVEQAQNKALKLSQKDQAKLTEQTQTTEPSVAIEPSADSLKTLRHVYESQKSAKRAARANWSKLKRGMASFNITLALGRPEIIPETPATVQGYKPQIDNTDWIVIKATHNLSNSGLTTALELEIKATELVA
ncbi:Late control D family protein [Ferriphaselus amnicola]|uniref:Late control D family protein n=1 Tax=Ferriphaselus amnicola TaxID=1188319 RepID=A0A2Z6GCV6_9PROT|nr:contractile injection system protein, VgrG/Pvc8 family [Ferriphaselus amnicola]BBE51152.1 Late control D family protein [Ferriphaselus amnicola]